MKTAARAMMAHTTSAASRTRRAIRSMALVLRGGAAAPVRHEQEQREQGGQKQQRMHGDPAGQRDQHENYDERDDHVSLLRWLPLSSTPARAAEPHRVRIGSPGEPRP